MDGGVMVCGGYDYQIGQDSVTNACLHHVPYPEDKSYSAYPSMREARRGFANAINRGKPWALGGYSAEG